jgi:hypothetical protein
MLPVRISRTKVRADGYIYSFERAADADGFLLCLATTDLNECEFRCQALSKRKFSVDQDDYLPRP